MLTTTLLWLLAVLLIIGGFAGMVVPALPGPVLLFAGLVVAAWAEGFQHVGAETLIVLGVLAVLAYVADFIAGSLGASRYGASRRAVVGAAIGAIVGIFFGLLGILLGPFVGAMIGELLARKSLREAGLAGYGATLGMIIGTAAKLALGFTMLGLFILMRFI